MIKDGLLLSEYAECNWAASFSGPDFTRTLPASRPISI